MKHTGICITSLLGGMLIGSALAMLFTPQSGADLRRQIKDFLDNEADKAEDKLRKIQERIEKTACKCND